MSWQEAILSAEKNTNSGVFKDWCHTRQDTKTFQFLWTIYQFSSRKEPNGQYFESSQFPAGLDSHKWMLRAYPHGIEERFKEYLGIAIMLQSGTNVSAQVECSIVNDNNEKLITRRSATFSFEQGENLHFPDFVNFHELRFNTILLPENKLNILCEVTMLCKSYNISGQTRDGIVRLPAMNLSEDFGALLESGQFSDVKLIAAGGHEFKANKAILSARSKVFAAIFQHPMKEQTTDRVVISDVHQEVLKAMLDFIYTDKACNLNNIVAELFAVSDKYEINNLKIMCEECLRANLGVENAATTLILAHRHNAKELKVETLKFFVGNAKAIVHTNGWNAMITSNAALIAEAFSAFAKAQLLLDEEMASKE